MADRYFLPTARQSRCHRRHAADLGHRCISFLQQPLDECRLLRRPCFHLGLILLGGDPTAAEAMLSFNFATWPSNSIQAQKK
jgi:hypothetical protein